MKCDRPLVITWGNVTCDGDVETYVMTTESGEVIAELALCKACLVALKATLDILHRSLMSKTKLVLKEGGNEEVFEIPGDSYEDPMSILLRILNEAFDGKTAIYLAFDARTHTYLCSLRPFSFEPTINVKGGRCEDDQAAKS